MADDVYQSIFEALRKGNSMAGVAQTMAEAMRWLPSSAGVAQTMAEAMRTNASTADVSQAIFEYMMFHNFPTGLVNGEFTSIGIGREFTFGSPVPPTVFLISDELRYFGANEFLERPGARKRIGRTKPATGMFSGRATASLELDPDNAGAIFAMALGSETVTANAANPAAAPVATTTTTATAIGFVDLTPLSMTNITVGQSLVIDSAMLQETCVVKATTATTFRVYCANLHAAGTAIVSAPVVLAYDHHFSLGSPRGFFTSQVNRIDDCIAFCGGKVSSLAVAVSDKAIITGTVGIAYQGEVLNRNPLLPSYSMLQAFKFTTAGNAVTIDGTVPDADVQAWSFAVDTGLVRDFPSFTNGRLRAQMPETITKVSGTLDLAFETMTMYQKFWGKNSSTGPQSMVLPVTLNFILASDDYINTTVPYALRVSMGTCLISADDVAIKANDYLRQSCKFECFESVNGASDDLQLVLTNAASAASI